MEHVELVFIPTTALSHIMAAVATAELLLSRAERRLSATVLIMNPDKDTIIDTYTDKISSSSNPHLRFIKLRPPEDSVPSPSHAFRFDYIESRAAEVRQIISDIIGKKPPAPAPPSQVAGVVLDFFTTNFIDVANEFGIPAYVFNPSSACNLGLTLHPEESEDGGSELSVPYLSVPLPAKVLPLRCLSEPGRVIEILLRFFRRLSEVKGIMTNTFYELEPYAIDELKSGDKGPKIYDVGPVLTNGCGGGGGDDEVTKWLDEQPEKSVVFLCFGSMGSLVAEQVREIALALENGGFRFLWSLRGGAAAALPEGFLERTEGVGRVIGWAAQAAVLAHAAVGCFVSHCGWNSTLESVWFGVPIAAFPLFGEQHLNAFELAEELKMAEVITLDYLMDFTGERAAEIVGAEKVEAAIRRVMAAEGGGVRRKVEEMKKKAREALMEGGSSYNALTLFIEDVFKNITPSMNF